MSIYQESINNNITWFITALGIFVALLGVVGVALYFLVQTAIKKGIERGLEESNLKISQLVNESNSIQYASGACILENHKFELQLYDLTHNRLLCFEVRDSEGVLINNKITITERNSIEIYIPTIKSGAIKWSVIWVKSKK